MKGPPWHKQTKGHSFGSLLPLLSLFLLQPTHHSHLQAGLASSDAAHFPLPVTLPAFVRSSFFFPSRPS